MDTSYVIRKERCPKCATLGKDQSQDNLAIYSDGHSYCYSCGFSIRGDVVSRFRGRISKPRELDKPESRLYLPEDCDVDYPERALDWVKQYEITRTDLLNHNTLWSESTQRLIFPVFGDTGLLAYQGRYFGPSAPEGNRPYPKWYGKGDLVNTFNILGGRSSPKLILTEDIISAIKCSQFYMAMPLYGCHIGVERFKRLYSLFKDQVEVCVYLDPDKRTTAIVEARRGALCGMKTRVIYSEADPKEHSYKELEEILK